MNLISVEMGGTVSLVPESSSRAEQQDLVTMNVELVR